MLVICDSNTDLKVLFKETIGNMIDGEVAVVDFEKTSELCNLTGCSSNPCYHNGRCEAKGSSFVCHCPREWTGTQCQIDVNECESGWYTYSLRVGPTAEISDKVAG